jgi:hypothetical protein
VTEPRTCPNCGTAERRWLEKGRQRMNLSPITGQCVDCLAALAREMAPPVDEPVFDPKAEAARNDA